MLLYVMSKDDFLTKDIRPISSCDLLHDIDLDDSSTVVIAEYIGAEDGDFAFIQDDNGKNVFFGVWKEITPGDNGYTVTLKQAETMFSTTVYTDNEDLIASTGIEDYIVRAVKDNFTESGDTLMDLDYVEIYASTHTPVAAKISTIASVESGVFNFKTFLGNCREYYNVFLDYYPVNGKLTIDVNVKEDPTINVDSTIPEIKENLEETYSVDVLARLRVLWKLNEDDDDPTEHFYYLRADRSVTDDKDDPERVDGTAKTIQVTAETESEMYQSVTNEFKSNSYNHNISFKILDSSKLYDVDDFYVGRSVRILTEHQGVVESIVTETEHSEESYIQVTLGKLPVTLTKKIRKEVR